MNCTKKIALVLVAIALIVSLTSCKLLESIEDIFVSTEWQEDWVYESQERVDMIFAKYMDFAEKTIKEHFPDADVEFESVLSESKGTDVLYNLNLQLDDFASFTLEYECFYQRPCFSEMWAKVDLCLDKTSTNEEIEAILKTYTEMLNELAKFCIYIFPQDNPFDSVHQLIIDEFDASSNVNDAGEKYDLHHEIWFPENNIDPTSKIVVLVYECNEHQDKVNVNLYLSGYLTNENALKY